MFLISFRLSVTFGLIPDSPVPILAMIRGKKPKKFLIFSCSVSKTDPC